MKSRFSRIALRLFRTGRYLADLLVWSRVFVVRRTAASIEFDAALLRKKAVAHHQPALRMQGRPEAQRFEHGFNIVCDILFANLRRPNHLVGLRHALPCPAFAGVYLWDSAFIALIWRHWDRAVAFDVLEAVVALRDGSKLQHVVADFLCSEFTQPPLIAWAAARIHADQPAAGAALRRLYEPLVAYHAWLDAHRRLRNGLYFWVHPYESGVDNSPRFSSRDESRLADTTQLAAADLSAYMVLQCEALATMAASLGAQAAAVRFVAEAARIRTLVNELLWHEPDGLYYDLDLRSGQLLRSRTIASLLPLAAGIPDPARAARLRDHCLDAGVFGPTVPFPSVALDDPDFEKDMWRGPVWINTAYMALDGLRRYGLERDYAKLAWRLCDAVFQVLEREHQVYEFYDPQHFHTRELQRKKGNWWKALTLGTKPQKDFVGWSGLVNNLLIEGLIGYRRQGDTLSLRPCFPEEARPVQLFLRLPQDDCEIRLEALADGSSRGSIEAGGHRHGFHIGSAETFRVSRSGATVSKAR